MQSPLTSEPPDVTQNPLPQSPHPERPRPLPPLSLWRSHNPSLSLSLAFLSRSRALLLLGPRSWALCLLRRGSYCWCACPQTAHSPHRLCPEYWPACSSCPRLHPPVHRDIRPIPLSRLLCLRRPAQSLGICPLACSVLFPTTTRSVWADWHVRWKRLLWVSPHPRAGGCKDSGHSPLGSIGSAHLEC